MKIGIYTNSLKDADFEVTRKLIDLLKSNGISFYLCENQKSKALRELIKGLGISELLTEKDYHMLDLMITVGGDGTVLSIAKACLNYDIPILPINKGTKGFLNEIEMSNLDRVIDVINGDYRTDKRILISATIMEKEYLALNELYVTRKNSGKMIKLSSTSNGRLIDKYFCDGLLVCTPTGSTAYSLSAGGPIISPSASVMCLNPVSSHCLRSRPIVIGDDECIEIVLDDDYDDAIFVIDGIIIDQISRTNRIAIKKSDKCIRFYRLKESSFYFKLLDKLNGLI